MTFFAAIDLLDRIRKTESKMTKVRKTESKMTGYKKSESVMYDSVSSLIKMFGDFVKFQ